MTPFGNLGIYCLWQQGHSVLCPTYCFIWVITSIETKSLFISSFSMVWHPHVHVLTLDTDSIASGELLTVGEDFLCPFSLPGFFPDFTRLFWTTTLKPFVEDGLQLLLLSLFKLIFVMPNLTSYSFSFFLSSLFSSFKSRYWPR